MKKKRPLRKHQSGLFIANVHINKIRTEAELTNNRK